MRPNEPPEFVLDAVVGEAVFHLERQRTADGVEPVDRIAWHQRHAADRGFRDEVPIDEIAEHLVDAYAVLINRETLRRADDRGGDKAAIIEVALKLVAGLIAERDARYAARQRAQQIGCGPLVEVRGRKRLDVRWDFVAVHGTGLGRGGPCGDRRRSRRRCRARCSRRWAPSGTTRRRHRSGADHLNFRKRDARSCGRRTAIGLRQRGGGRQHRSDGNTPPFVETPPLRLLHRLSDTWPPHLRPASILDPPAAVSRKLLLKSSREHFWQWPGVG